MPTGCRALHGAVPASGVTLLPSAPLKRAALHPRTLPRCSARPCGDVQASSQPPFTDERPHMSLPRRPWRWVASAYFAQGVPFALVMSAASSLLKDLHYTDASITAAIGTISLAWSIKPLYAGFLELLWPIRSWVISTELSMAAWLLMAAAALFVEDPFWPLCALLACIALSSATHDIAVDGVFVTELGAREQSRWAGFCGSAWNGGRLFATAAMVGVASLLQSRLLWDARRAWAAALAAGAVCLWLLAVYHQRALPPAVEVAKRRGAQVLTEFAEQWQALLSKPGFWGMLTFVVFYRCSEGFLLLEVPLFLQAGTSHQGLGLCAIEAVSKECPHFLSDRALLDGVLGTLVSAAFGILGGKYLEWQGLTRRSLFLMALCLNVPHLSLVVLSQLASAKVAVAFPVIAGLTLVEKAGYSFGFVANMVYMMQRIAPGRYPTAHYAFATGLMQLLLVPVQSLSGPLALWLGYPHYFILACVAAVPSLWVALRAPLGVPQAPQPTEAGLEPGR
jgi:MFS transporter, PAT family, beta-lactamase induction signal transducer AmpG